MEEQRKKYKSAVYITLIAIFQISVLYVWARLEGRTFADAIGYSVGITGLTIAILYSWFVWQTRDEKAAIKALCLGLFIIFLLSFIIGFTIGLFGLSGR